jgi:hypothetical protein
MQITQRVWSTIVAGALLLGAIGVAQQSGLVNVNLSNIRADIAKDINVDVSQIPVTVQAPIGVAANVCGVDANVLAQQRKEGGDLSCDATSTNEALNQIVQRQLKRQQ